MSKWIPDARTIAASNISAACRRLNLPDYAAFHRWSVESREAFWKDAIDTLGIRFATPPDRILDDSRGAAHASWLPGARMNIAESCFSDHPESPAIVFRSVDSDEIDSISVAQLRASAARVATSLPTIGVRRGDAVAIAMPMTVEAVATYIGIVMAGCVVVSIADSFAPPEIAARLRIAGARAAVTQDIVRRGERTFPMYDKVVEAGAKRIVVATAGDAPAVRLRPDDVLWNEFLSGDGVLEAVYASPDDTTNILFSSGTTGDPKAIPWSHTTPIKCAMDGLYHHDIHPGDVVAWPTNLGWMMGPWLIYAALINHATIALYYGAPNTPGFCRFVQDARVNMLGVVPSLVRAWRADDMQTPYDWSAIRAFSSTGEASNADDMAWLMQSAGGRPVIEYCGGTEIGGGYITQTVVQPAIPATFSTPALGIDVVIVDEAGVETRNGELFIVPPSIGLSRTLLNRDHDSVYYADTPGVPNRATLRRHGDQVERLDDGYFRAHGRADDTMNIGGIKVSSAELERVANTVDGVAETAAIAINPPGGGPSQLVIFAVMEPDAKVDPAGLKGVMQRRIAGELNPLFRLHDVVAVEALPRTASNKVMRRVLRDQYS